MIESINELLETNDIMVFINGNWYRLNEIQLESEHSMPIMVSDDDGTEHEFDMADIEEFNNSDVMEPIFMLTNSSIVGIA